MIKHYIAIIWCLAFLGGLITGKSVFAGEWNDKPVMCENTRVTLKAIQAKGEILLMTGVQSAKVRNPDEPNGLADKPVHLALQIFINMQTKTFTIVEYHPSYDVICIIAYGDDFNSIILESN